MKFRAATGVPRGSLQQHEKFIKEPCAMIQYSCDGCKRIIDPHDDLRYVVRMEIYAAIDTAEIDDGDDDRDYLMEIQDIVQRGEDVENDRIGDDVYQQLRFDLCPECRGKFLKSPICRETAKQFDFSEN
jgi:hypothetical protein